MRRFENNMYDSYTYVRTTLNEKKNLLPEKDIDEINRMSEGGDEPQPEPEIRAIKFTGNNSLSLGSLSTYGTWEWSYDGETWTEFDISDHNEYIPFTEQLYVRVDSSTREEGYECFPCNYYGLSFAFESDSPVDVSGDIMCLVNYNKVAGDDLGSAYGSGAFDGLFRGCPIKDASRLNLSFLEFPFEYDGRVYAHMFHDCDQLTVAPSLPATTLKTNCYNGMFIGCTSLTTSPELPATELTEYCYDHIFEGCTSLTTAPELPATELEEYCYYGMFIGCTSLTTPPELPATELARGCYGSMFDGCISLTETPELPATELAGGCCEEMFKGCTSLMSASELPATVLASNCYRKMFSGCTSLRYVTCLATDVSADNCLKDWLSNVSSTGTFTKKTGVEYPEGSIPENWTVNEQ